jgi:hypothetical protein
MFRAGRRRVIGRKLTAVMEEVRIFPRGDRPAFGAAGRQGRVFRGLAKEFPAQLVATARTFVGCSRAKTPDQITEFFALFHLAGEAGNPSYAAYAAAGSDSGDDHANGAVTARERSYEHVKGFVVTTIVPEAL